jgi:hypothetical protein
MFCVCAVAASKLPVMYVCVLCVVQQLSAICSPDVCAKLTPIYCCTALNSVFLKSLLLVVLQSIYPIAAASVKAAATGTTAGTAVHRSTTIVLATLLLLLAVLRPTYCKYYCSTKATLRASTSINSSAK